MDDIQPREPDQTERFDPLLKVAMWSVGIGLTVLAVLAVLASTIPWEGFWRGAGQPYATTLAALAAISAAAIALHNSRSQLIELREQRNQDQARYEEQRDRDHTRYEEQREQDQARWEDQRARDEIKDLRTRFTEATAQLADASPTIRSSGAYALAALANDWHTRGELSEVMVCFRVLGAYTTTTNPTFTSHENKADAGADGPVRALIVSLLSENSDLYAQGDGTSDVLQSADLRAVKFNGPIARADLSDADLRQADFTATVLQDARLTHAKLAGADLSHINLQGADLWFADLTGATMWWSDLRGANLSMADLEGVDIEAIKHDDKTRWPEGFVPPA